MPQQNGVSPKLGDVFEVPINESQVGYGQVAGQRFTSYLLAIFKTAYRRGEHPELSRITADDIAFLAESLDAKIWNGDWAIVGNLPPDRSRIRLPVYKVTVGNINSWFVESYDGSQRRPAHPNELNILALRTVVAPARLEKALQALHGARPWEPAFDQLQYSRVSRSGES